MTARLWYDTFCDFLSKLGYTPNPIDRCVLNKTNEKGEQCTGIFHVDDRIRKNVI